MLMILYSYVYRCCMIIVETLKLSFVHDVKHCSPICFFLFISVMLIVGLYWGA